MNVSGRLWVMGWVLFSSIASAGESDVEAWQFEELLRTVDEQPDREESTSSADGTVTVLSAEEIARSGVSTIPDLLRRVPGLQVISISPGNVAVSARGLGGLQNNNVLVLVDGIAVNTAVDGSVHWDMLPVTLAQISRIEVIRGPGNALYGANASAAVVRIFTNPSDPRPLAGVALGMNVPTMTQRHFWASGGGGSDVVGWRINVHGDEVQPTDDENQIGHRGGLGSDITVLFKPASRWSGSTYFSWMLGVRGTESPLIIVPGRALESVAMSGLNLRYEPDGWVRHVALDGGYVARRSEPVGETNGALRADASESMGDVNVTVEVGLPNKGSLELSMGAGGEQVRATFLPLEPIWHPKAQALLRARQPLGRHWTLGGGARVESHILTGVRGSGTGSVHFVPSETVAIRLSAGSTYRRPTWIEKASRFRDTDNDVILLEGAPGLEAQRSTTLEASVSLTPGGGLWFRPLLFAARFDSLITRDNGPFVLKSFLNTETNRPVDIAGVEFEWAWEKDTRFEPHGSFAWAYLAPAVDEGVTVGVPQQNARLSGSVSVRGTLGRARYGVSLDVMDSRAFDVGMGLPVVHVTEDIPMMTRVGAEFHWEVGRRPPLTVGVIVQTNQPSVAQSPIPGATPLGTQVLLVAQVRE